MPKDRRQRIILGILIVIILAVLAFCVKDSVRERLVEPLLYLLWPVMVLYTALPQIVTWLILVLIGSVIFMNRILELPEIPDKKAVPQGVYRGQLEKWTEWIHRANRGNLLKFNLFLKINSLIIETVAFQEDIPVKEARKLFNNGELGLSAEIRKVVDIHTQLEESESFSLWDAIFKSKPKISQVNQDLESIIHYLETKLEAPIDQQE